MFVFLRRVAESSGQASVRAQLSTWRATEPSSQAVWRNLPDTFSLFSAQSLEQSMEQSGNYAESNWDLRHSLARNEEQPEVNRPRTYKRRKRKWEWRVRICSWHSRYCQASFPTVSSSPCTTPWCSWSALCRCSAAPAPPRPESGALCWPPRGSAPSGTASS